MLLTAIFAAPFIAVLIYAFWVSRNELDWERAVWIACIVIAWELVLLSISMH
jgi:hypothetical protein